jgi:type I restriction enzyme R subunit
VRTLLFACRAVILRPVPYPSLPVQAADRADLREKLRVAGGGVVFTTIQKFMPAEQGDRNAVLSDRRNIVVIADEAHRSQYDFIDGFARHMRDVLPQASFARTRTRAAGTRAVFGDASWWLQ